MDRRLPPLRTLVARTAVIASGLAAGLATGLAVGNWPRDPIATARWSCIAFAIAATAIALHELPRRGAELLRHLLARPRRLRIAVAMGGTFAALLVGEGAVRASGVAADPDIGVRAGSFVEPDPSLGYRLIAATNTAVTLTHGTDGNPTTVHYGVDGHGRRRTVLPAANGHDRAVLFFGCSQTFGHGLDDGSTVPSRYAAAMPRDLVVNFAVPGYGPHHALVLARDDRAMKSVPELPRPPVAVFVWIDHHLLRLCGSLRVRNFYGLDAPCFAVDANGHAELRGPFRSAEPVRTAWFWALGKSRLLAATGYDWPGSYRDEDTTLAAAIFDDLAIALAKRGGRLMLAQYPGERMLPAVLARLRQRDIVGVDLTGLFEPHGSGIALDRDGHPTPRATQLLGDRLAAEVQRAFP